MTRRHRPSREEKLWTGKSGLDSSSVFWVVLETHPAPIFPSKGGGGGGGGERERENGWEGWENRICKQVAKF